MNTIIDNIFNTGIVPEINESNLNDLDQLLKLNVTTVTVKNPGFASVVSKANDKFIIGLTNVVSLDNLNDDIKFIITKDFDLDLIKSALDRELLVIPTINSLNEIKEAKALGLNLLNYAGTDFKKIDELNDTNFILSSKANISKVFKNANVYACLTSSIDNIYQDIIKMHNFEITHVGINMNSPEEAKNQADEFSNMFGLTTNETPIAYFAGSMFELMKNPFLGKNGHISVGVNNIPRAISYFNNMGYTFGNYMYKPDGSILLCYFDKEFSGFAVHLR